MKDLSIWHKKAPQEYGFHSVIKAGRDETKSASVYTLKLKAGDSYELESKNEEMNGLLITGDCELSGKLDGRIKKLDSFYIPSKTTVKITAVTNCEFYIGAAECEDYGKPFVRHMDFTLPIGDIHQIHGEGSGQREVMFTLAPQDSASRLLCGVTWSGDGAWTSWPPHQHEKDLEEVYCYFDMPSFGLHLSYTTDENFGAAYTHVVSNGSMIEVPCGYHPTCAIPNSRNVYFWIMAAHSHESRRYDLAVTDPDFLRKD